MQFRSRPAAALAIVSAAMLGACAPLVEVTPMHPTPRCIMARAASSVKVFERAPDNGVAVYGLVASEGDTRDLYVAIQTKAADLGCDGVLIARSEAGTPTRGDVATGQLNAQPVQNSERVTALCIVMR